MSFAEFDGAILNDPAAHQAGVVLFSTTLACTAFTNEPPTRIFNDIAPSFRRCFTLPHVPSAHGAHACQKRVPSDFKKKLLSKVQKKAPSESEKKLPSITRKIYPSKPQKKVLDICTPMSSSKLSLRKP
jgi:hypothetical protein